MTIITTPVIPTITATATTATIIVIRIRRATTGRLAGRCSGRRRICLTPARSR
jgi:hypothetical protein